MMGGCWSRASSWLLGSEGKRTRQKMAPCLLDDEPCECHTPCAPPLAVHQLACHCARPWYHCRNYKFTREFSACHSSFWISRGKGHGLPGRGSVVVLDHSIESPPFAT